jgi:hypothetical protein
VKSAHSTRRKDNKFRLSTNSINEQSQEAKVTLQLSKYAWQIHANDSLLHYFILDSLITYQMLRKCSADRSQERAPFIVASATDTRNKSVSLLFK